MTHSDNGDGLSAFKRAQVKHRRQGTRPNRHDDLDCFVDFSTSMTRDDGIYPVDSPSTSNDNECLYDGPIYGISDFPGFLFAPQALSPSLQLNLAFAAVSEYCEAPHATNIDLVPPKAGKEENNIGQSMWELWKQQNGHGETPDGSNAERTIGTSLKHYRSFSKLSWSTMGYQYDWTARAYQEGAKSPMPLLLEEVASVFAHTSLAVCANTSTKFTASASIVNYYNTKSIMGGHRDDLELALDKPVISLSLGLPAVFLLGGKTKEDEPVLPILVRPGDVMILGGESRLNYHGMARVLPAAVAPANVSDVFRAPQLFQLTSASVLSQRDASEREPRGAVQATVPGSDQVALRDYLSTHRININVRQVLPDDMAALPPVPN